MDFDGTKNKNIKKEDLVEAKKSDFNGNKFKSFFSIFVLFFSLFSLNYFAKGYGAIKRSGEIFSTEFENSQTIDSNDGKWKKSSFYAYSGCDDKKGATACTLKKYDTDSGWTELNYEDGDWKNGKKVDNEWWNDGGWSCKKELNLSIENIEEDFSKTHGLTGLYRKKFTLEKDISEIKNVTMKMFSDNKTAVYINGKLVSENKETCYDINIPLSVLKSKENIIAVQLSNDKVNKYDNPMGLGFLIKIEYSSKPLSCSSLTINNSPTEQTFKKGERVTVRFNAPNGEKNYLVTRKIEPEVTDWEILTVLEGTQEYTFTLPSDEGKYQINANIFANQCTRMCGSWTNGGANPNGILASVDSCGIDFAQINGQVIDDCNNNCDIKYSIKEDNPPMCRDMKFVIEKPNGSFSTNMSQISKGDTIYYTCNGSKDVGNYANFQIKRDGSKIGRGSRELLSTKYKSIFNSAGVSVSNEEYYWSYQIPNNAPDGSYFVECEVCDKDNNCTGLSN